MRPQGTSKVSARSLGQCTATGRSQSSIVASGSLSCTRIVKVARCGVRRTSPSSVSMGGARARSRTRRHSRLGSAAHAEELAAAFEHLPEVWRSRSGTEIVLREPCLAAAAAVAVGSSTAAA